MNFDDYVNENPNLFKSFNNINSYDDIKNFFKSNYKNDYKNRINRIKILAKREFESKSSNFFKRELQVRDKIILILNDYKQFNGEYIHKNKIKKILLEENKKIKNNGYIIDPFNKNISLIKFKNIYFYKSQHIIKYIFETESKIDFIRITELFVEKINHLFNAKIKNLRSFSSLLERQLFLRKIDSDTFCWRKSNEVDISIKLSSIISKNKYNFLTKKYQKLLFDKVIRDYKLIDYEYYYILKYYYPKKYIYSSGNSMTISINKELSSMSIQERINWYTREKPAIISVKDISTQLGISQFVLVNFKNCYALEKKIILINFKNKKNFLYIKKTFDKFLINKKGKMFSSEEFRRFLRTQNEFFKKLSNLYSFSIFFNEIYRDKIKYFKNYKKYLYIDNKQNIIMDVDNWSDF